MGDSARLGEPQKLRAQAGKQMLLWMLMAACGLAQGAEPALHSLRVQQGELTVVFRDNSQSPMELSGLQSLVHTAAPEFDAFDPDTLGASAGLNFEHIICGHPDPSNAFSPRHGALDEGLEPSWASGVAPNKYGSSEPRQVLQT